MKRKPDVEAPLCIHRFCNARRRYKGRSLGQSHRPDTGPHLPDTLPPPLPSHESDYLAEAPIDREPHKKVWASVWVRDPNHPRTTLSLLQGREQILDEATSPQRTHLSRSSIPQAEITPWPGLAESYPTTRPQPLPANPREPQLDR